MFFIFRGFFQRGRFPSLGPESLRFLLGAHMRHASSSLLHQSWTSCPAFVCSSSARQSQACQRHSLLCSPSWFRLVANGAAKGAQLRSGQVLPWRCLGWLLRIALSDLRFGRTRLSHSLGRVGCICKPLRRRWRSWRRRRDSCASAEPPFFFLFLSLSFYIQIEQRCFETGRWRRRSWQPHLFWIR